MDNVTDRLTKCFLTVFPGLDKSQVQSASAETVSDWDSIAQVNLLSVIGEEFGLDIDFEEFEDATSFEKLRDHLRELSPSA